MSDKRTVSTDALETLGTIIGPNEKRDAIHLAVIPMQAGAELLRGEHVGIVRGKAHNWHEDGVKFVGIVDPFLGDIVHEGEWCWVLLYPRQISSLRHVWTHPDIPDDEPERREVTENERSKAEDILRRFATSNDCDYEEIQQRMHYAIKVGHAHFDDGFQEWDSDEVWRAFEIVSGRKVPVLVLTNTTIECCA